MKNQNVDKLIDAANKIAESLATTSEHILEVYQKAFLYEGVIGAALCALFAGMITFVAYKMLTHIKKDVDNGGMDRDLSIFLIALIAVVYVIAMPLNMWVLSDYLSYIASPEAHAVKRYMADVGHMMHGR
jgi:exosortase/archaeosortase